MNKIICEICGTVYPDTNEVCPICGYPRDNSKTLIDDNTVTAAPAANAARVKGGRYSSKNVKKRNHAAAAGENHREPDRTRNPEKATRGQIITVILLCIAIVLVSCYIGWRFYKGRDAYDNPSLPTEPSTAPSTVPTTLPTEPSVDPNAIPCQNLTISGSAITFQRPGESWWLMVVAEPEDTTDELVILSSNEDVVTVTGDGLVTAVGPGTATITVTCGEISRVCVVNCLFDSAATEPEETTEPVETTKPTEPTEPEETTKPTKPAETGLVLSHKDVTLFKEGETFRISVKYNGETVSPASASFSSKDDTVATVESNGEVTAVGPGTTTITVSYNGETAKCIIRCDIEPEETEETEPTEETESTEETEPTEEEVPGWQISNTDVTIRVGETFRLRLTNAAGETANVAWSISKSDIVSVDGNTVTGLADGRVTLSATVDGQTYSCIVRVKG